MHITGKADYIAVVHGVVGQDLYMADFLSSGAKEAFAHGNPTEQQVQEDMIGRLRPMGFVGWISWHDKGDDRLELCVFPEFVGTALIIDDAYVYGP